MRHLLRMSVAALVAACSNAGADRVLTIPGTGQVRGLIYLDRNGDTVFTGVPDAPLTTARIALIAQGTIDTLKRVTSDSGTLFAGSPVNFAFVPVPAGSYRVAVDTMTIPHDSMRITKIDSVVTVSAGDTAFVRIAVTFPAATPPAARALPLRTKVFVTGIILANINTYGDSTNSLADPTGAGAIRVIQVKPTLLLAAGDSIRLLASVDTFAGQPVLRFVNLIAQFAASANTPISTLTVGQAKTANAGVADAGLVALPGRVVIQDTVTGQNGRIVHVTDTTVAPIDTLEVQLDSTAGFDTTVVKRDTIGARVRLRGILLPSAIPGRWVLKPRSPLDQT